VIQQYYINCQNALSQTLPNIREQLDSLAVYLFDILMGFCIEGEQGHSGSILTPSKGKMNEDESEKKNMNELDSKSNEHSYLSIMTSVYRLWEKIQTVISEGFHALYNHDSERRSLLIDMIRSPSSYHHVLPGLSRGLEMSCSRQGRGHNLYHSICLDMYGDTEAPYGGPVSGGGGAAPNSKGSSVAKELSEKKVGQPHTNNEGHSSKKEQPLPFEERQASATSAEASLSANEDHDPSSNIDPDNITPTLSISELETLLRHIKSHHLSDQRIGVAPNPFRGSPVDTYAASPRNMELIYLNGIYKLILTRQTVSFSLFEIVRSILAAMLHQLHINRNMDTCNSEEPLLMLMIDCICLDVKGVFLLYDNEMTDGHQSADASKTDFDGDRIRSFLDLTFTTAILPFLTILYTQNNDIESMIMYLPFALKLLGLLDNLCMVRKGKNNVRFTIMTEWLEDHVKWVRIYTCCMNIYVFLSIHIYNLYICIYVFLYICKIDISAFIYTYVYIYVETYTDICIYTIMFLPIMNIYLFFVHHSGNFIPTKSNKNIDKSYCELPLLLLRCS
jgi:hypothetical protein